MSFRICLFPLPYQVSSEEEGIITLLGAFGEDGGRMHGMEENEVRYSGLLLLWGGSRQSWRQ